MHQIDSVCVKMAMEEETVIENIRRNSEKNIQTIESLPEWRETSRIAIVGGGPSLNETIEELRSFDNVMACGSAHDHLIGLGIKPKWTVISDPDPIMAEYLRKPISECTYLVASMCDEAVFEALNGHKKVLWHSSSNDNSSKLWGEKPKILVGGGCTVGTRAFIIAITFGYRRIHLFGFDTCIRDGEHHAYGFATGGEEIGALHDVALGSVDGPRYKMAGYMLGQFFDFKKLFKDFESRTNITIHGGGALAEMFVKNGDDEDGENE